VIWAIVGYFSSFYRDLELSNPIQLILNIVSQLAIVLVVIYAGLYLFRQNDISRTYVLLIGWWTSFSCCWDAACHIGASP